MSSNGMTTGASGRGPERSWVREPESRGGLSRFIALARDHWRLMLVLIAFVVGAAVLAVNLTSKSYEAEAILSVSPVASSDHRFDGISVIRETSVPGRDVETLARLVKTTPVAQAAASSEGVSGSPEALLSKVTVTPIGGSFLVSVSAEGSTPEGAAALANAFAKGAVNVRSAQFREQVDGELKALQAQLSASAGLPDATIAQLNDRVASLQALEGANDPSVQLETEATKPDGPTTPPLKLIVAIALVVGVIVAFGGAVAVDTASSRVRTEGQLTERFNLPVLARIPKTPSGSPGQAVEGYRDLAQSIAVLRRDPNRPRSLLFTSAGDGENRTTAAVEAARMLADAGQRVLLIDTDLRQPAIHRILGIDAQYGTGSVMMGRVRLEEATVAVPGVRGSLEVLSGYDPDSVAAAVAMSPASVDALLTAGTAWFDFIIFDGAPLGTVSDAIPVAGTVDDVIVVVRRGEAELARLARLADVLVRNDIVPSGLCLVDWPRRSSARRQDPALETAAERRSRASKRPEPDVGAPPRSRSH